MVAQSLASLLQRASIDDHEEVLQSCNAVLAKSKSDLKAQHIKVIALLKLDRYEEALKTFQSGGSALKQSAALEYAYASYKCGNLEQATEAVTQAAAGRGASHLEAQVVWRSTLSFVMFRGPLLTHVFYSAIVPTISSGQPSFMSNFPEIRPLTATKLTT
jgi:tetratricopeptide (TPR) repeat protein